MSTKANRSGRDWMIGLAIGSLLIGGCQQRLVLPKLGTLYNRSARHRDPYRNPVIVIPGILGSKLVDPTSGRLAWGAFGGDSVNPTTKTGMRLVSLPMQEGFALAQLRDEVRPAGALDRIRINFAGLPITLNAYTKILATLGAGGYRDDELGESGAIDYGGDHYTCFQFDYDWRRDNVENAKRLGQFVQEKKSLVEGELKKRFGLADHEVKFDIVAHSMGGLIARYYLRYGEADLPVDGSLPEVTWAGAEHVQNVVLVGTPNGGSLDALNQLVNGIQFSPLLPKYEAVIIGTMPAVYQLLPRSRHGGVVDDSKGQAIGDLFDPVLWEQLGWGLAGEDQDRVLKKLLPETSDAHRRRQIALDHQRKCLVRARHFTVALDQPTVPPAGVKLYMFAGDAEPTESKIGVNRKTGRLKTLAHAPGDGTVLRSSAVLDERVGGHWQPRLKTPIAWQHVQFLFTDHLGMTADPAFSDNVLHLLLEAAR